MASTQLNPAAAAFTPVARPQTPPEQMLSQAVDPDTPRSDAGKRQAKEDPQGEIDPRFSSEAQKYIRKYGLCFRCGNARPCTYCPKHPTVGNKHITQISAAIVFAHKHHRPKPTPAVASSSTGDMAAAERNIRVDPFAKVPPFCTKCRISGHRREDCEAPDCRYCKSGDHVGAYCLLKPATLYG